MKNFLNTLDPDIKKMLKVFLIIIGCLVLLLVGILGSRIIFGTKVGYSKLETEIEKAAIKYYSSDENELPSEEGESKKVTTSELVSGKYMREMDKYTKDTSCVGTVLVTNNGGKYLYNTTLDCADYKTKTIGDVLKASLVTEKSGLYLAENEYYYRGEYVNNYIKIDNIIYRILGIDSNGYIKVINPNLERKKFVWDNRYNSEKNQDGLGINDYDKSRIKETFNSTYDSYVDTTKKYIVKYDWCIGKRSIEDMNLAPVECGITLSDYVSTIIPSEFARASLDEKCDSIDSGNCKNYNYLSNLFETNIWTLSSVADNTYESYLFNSGIIDHNTTLHQFSILKSFNISDSNIYVSGDGSESNPFTIK